MGQTVGSATCAVDRSDSSRRKPCCLLQGEVEIIGFLVSVHLIALLKMLVVTLLDTLIR